MNKLEVPFGVFGLLCLPQREVPYMVYDHFPKIQWYGVRIEGY